MRSLTDDVQGFLSTTRPRKRFLRIGWSIAVVFVLLATATTAGTVLWSTASTPITAAHASQLSTLVADTAHATNLSPQTLWAGLKRHTGAYARDDMTEADYAKALIWLKSKTSPH